MNRTRWNWTWMCILALGLVLISCVAFGQARTTEAKPDGWIPSGFRVATGETRLERGREIVITRPATRSEWIDQFGVGGPTCKHQRGWNDCPT